MFWLDPLSELVTVTVPDVPPPLIPVPAVTPVISPWQLLNGNSDKVALATQLPPLLNKIVSVKLKVDDSVYGESKIRLLEVA